MDEFDNGFFEKNKKIIIGLSMDGRLMDTKSKINNEFALHVTYLRVKPEQRNK